MEKNRNLWIVYISAEGLEPVKLPDKMEVYAVVWISGGGLKTKQTTDVDRDGGTNPTWNDPMNFLVQAESGSAQSLVFELRSDKGIDIGKVRVPVKDLMGSIEDSPTYPVQTPSGNLNGHLNFMYEWADKAAGAVSPPATACYPPVMRPPSPHGATGAETGQYPPHRPPYVGEIPPAPQLGPPQGYGYPPQPGYGYGYGYGYPPVQQPPANNNTFPRFAGWLGRIFAGAAMTDILNNGPPDDFGS